jgi:TolB-like protein/Tfp pilus assembly protein PilF
VSERPSFFAELKRRNVLRAAALYIGAAWALSQGVAQLLPVFDFPNWVIRWFVIAALIGFPFAMLFSWFYEWTPHGIQRESEVEENESITHETGKKLDRLIIAVLSVAVVLLLANTFVLHQDAATVAGPTAPGKSIAVLPFLNMSGDPKNDYFSDGITEEILNALAQVPDLKVAARTSAFAFKGKSDDLRKIGQELDVATVLEGSVQTFGGQVRITAQLIDARNGYHLWSEKYDRKLTDVFVVEDDISAAIADKLQTQLRAGARAAGASTDDPRAHELYLRGLSLLAARGPGLRDAADAFEQAVTIDPHYAQAWAGLAQAKALVWNWHLDTEGTAQAQAEAAAQRALGIDPDNATAYVALGILDDDRWQWADADKALRRAMKLAPGDAETIDQYAQFLDKTGHPEPALPQIEHANELDPKSGIIGSVHAQILLNMRRCDEASAQIVRTLAAAPDSRHAIGVGMYVAVYCKHYAQAEEQARRLAVLAGIDPALYGALVQGVADPTRRAEALRLVRANPVPDWGWQNAYWLMLLGDREGALTVLETHFANSRSNEAEALWNPAFDPVRDDPRFKSVLARIGIPYPAKNPASP